MTRIRLMLPLVEVVGDGALLRLLASKLVDRMAGVIEELDEEADAEFAPLEWIGWFNNRRLLGADACAPRAELEAACDQQLRIGYSSLTQTSESPEFPGAVHRGLYTDVVASTHAPDRTLRLGRRSACSRGSGRLVLHEFVPCRRERS